MLVAFSCIVSATNPIVLTSETFDATTMNSKPTFVKFFAPWCGHCKKMKPDWDKLASNVDSGKITIADVDCTGEGKKICEAQDIKGFPTLKYFEEGDVDDYEGERTYEKLKEFADNISSMKKCSSNKKENCNDSELALLNKYADYSVTEVETQILKIKEEIEKLDTAMSELLKELQSQYDKAMEETTDSKKKLKAETKILRALLKDAKTNSKVVKEDAKEEL